MKHKIFFRILLFLSAGLFVQGVRTGNSPAKPVSPFRNTNAISCAPGIQENTDAADNGKFITILPGWGNHIYTVTAVSDSARFYFNQGLSMYYSYHAREALASFKESARFDSNCAMAYWGQALALGPSYNFAHEYVMRKSVPAALEYMNRSAAYASSKEKELIRAMNERYIAVDSSDKQRNSLNKAYAASMKELTVKYPDDQDLHALYVDAVMLIHPWNFWNNNGSPKAWTTELVKMTEEILETNPEHPGALHYYIHLTEASRHPEKALSSADVLKDLMSGVAHMVHMSSHEYERNGFYAKGVEVNEKADENLMRYDSLTKGLFKITHVPHYFAVESYCALSGGMYKKGMPKAFRCRQSVSPDYKNTYDQKLFMMPVMARVRLGKWEEILKDTVVPDARWPYARFLHDFAKGMALANTGNPEAAKRHLNALREKSKDSILQVRDIPFNTPHQVAVVAENILAANILFGQKKYKASLDRLKTAIRAEDSLIYIEPKDWMIPARQYMGKFLLGMKKPAAAEKVYREDLAWNPGNGWSLLGLYQSLYAQNKTREAAKYKPQYLQSFSEADEIPPASAY